MIAQQGSGKEWCKVRHREAWARLGGNTATGKCRKPSHWKEEGHQKRRHDIISIQVAIFLFSKYYLANICWCLGFKKYQGCWHYFITLTVQTGDKMGDFLVTHYDFKINSNWTQLDEVLFFKLLNIKNGSRISYFNFHFQFRAQK